MMTDFGKTIQVYLCQCGWVGLYVDLIQAGLNHELCPDCEGGLMNDGQPWEMDKVWAEAARILDEKPGRPMSGGRDV